MNTKMKIIPLPFDMVKPGEVFLHNGEFFLKLYKTDSKGRLSAYDAVKLNGEVTFFLDETSVFVCKNACISFEKDP